MATVTLHAASAANGSPEEQLSEDQITSLLQEAETRLRDAANAKTLAGSISKLPKLKSNLSKDLYIREHNGIANADSARLLDNNQRRLSEAVRNLDTRERKGKSEKTTAGQDWFDLPRTEMTPHLKRDLQLLNMRSVLDPHRHYKKSGKMKVPVFSQVGTVIEGPTEYYSARINKKDRQKNFVEEALAGEKESGKYKRKYEEIQAAKRSGKKAHYKALKARRKGKL
ncbi:MAG: hypothetical protein Q9227_007568 [Pyrenula ochraceoflavens]